MFTQHANTLQVRLKAEPKVAKPSTSKTSQRLSQPPSQRKPSPRVALPAVKARERARKKPSTPATPVSSMSQLSPSKSPTGVSSNPSADLSTLSHLSSVPSSTPKSSSPCSSPCSCTTGSLEPVHRAQAQAACRTGAPVSALLLMRNCGVERRVSCGIGSRIALGWTACTRRKSTTGRRSSAQERWVAGWRAKV